jgi:hypothetical protein
MTDELLNLKLDQYMTEFGQSESVELMERLSKSKLFNENLNIALNRHEIPSGKTINSIIHSSHYKFLLAGKRKIYFSSLFFLKALCEKYRKQDFQPDELALSRSLLQVCELYAD